MLIASVHLSKKFALDLMAFRVIRSFLDGLTLFDLKINFDRYKGDHNPKFELALVFFNTTIFELNIYNVNHINEGEQL